MARAKQPRFWLVWCETNPVSSARHKHYSDEAAQTEAERLSALNPGQSFVVLKAVGGAKSSAKVKPISFCKPDPDLEIPF